MRKLTPEAYKTRIEEIHSGNIKLLSAYVNSRVKVNALCNSCNHQWSVDPRSLYRCGCPECGKIKAAQTVKWHVTHEDFLSTLDIDVLNNINVLDQYVNHKTRITVQCKKCQRQWTPKPLYLQRGHGCSCTTSKGEGKIATLLAQHGVSFKSEYTFSDLKGTGGGRLRFDFGILNPDQTLSHLIEYDGLYHFQAFPHLDGEAGLEKQIIHDNLKNSYCEQKNIRLIRIIYTNYDTITINDLL